MKTQRRIPLVSLIVLSVLVCLGALVMVWVLSVDAKTILEKIQSSLTLGIPSAIALIILLWLGAGVDHLLARIQKKTTRLLASLGVYLVAPGTLCIGLPALLIILFSGSLFPQKGWQELPTPPVRPLEVAAAGESSVTILTESDEYYYCWVITPDDCWRSTAQPEERIIQNSMGDLKEISISPSSEPPQKAINWMGVSYHDTGIEVQVHYAVLEDGSVWYLEKDADKYETGFATGLFMTLAIIPAISGLLVIYLGAGISALSRRFANQASPEN